MNCRRIPFVAGFCIAGLVASSAFAGKPVKPPGKPGGGKDGTKAECIVFADNGNDKDWGEGYSHVWLEGGQECAIEGCCPNAGPFPQYEMALHNVSYTPAFGPDEDLVEELVLGYLYMNSFGRNAPYEGWKVQFWTCDYQTRRPHDGDFFFQIRGGTEVPQPKKSKVSVIEFLDADDATLWVYYDENDCDWTKPDCEPCANGMIPACDWENDPDSVCLYPCWIEEPLENVSFVIVRTADLTYSSTELGITCPNTTCPTP